MSTTMFILQINNYNQIMIEIGINMVTARTLFKRYFCDNVEYRKINNNLYATCIIK